MPDSSLIISIILVFIISFLVLFKPLFLDQQAPYFQPESESDAFCESLSILEMLTELETDHQMGKVSKEDFDALSLEYKHLYLKKKAEENG